MKKSDIKLLIAALGNLKKASSQLCRAAQRLEDSGGAFHGFRVCELIRDIEGTVDEEIQTLKRRISLLSEISELFNDDEMREIKKLTHY